VYPRIRNMGYAAVRTDRHKYIEYRELKDMDELYDLEADPFEEHNLVGIGEARPTLDRMRSELRRVLAETGYDAGRESARQSGP
jgi:arylsulfatase A-like enzyme